MDSQRIDEGLAEYSTYLYLLKNEGKNSANNLIDAAKSAYRSFFDINSLLSGNADTRMNKNLNEFTSEYEYVNMAYIKPCIMYDKLRVTIGEEKFFNSLKSYYKNYKMKNATPDDLVGAFEKTGADTNGFFKSFFEGKVII